jgi:hypothetical protein
LARKLIALNFSQKVLNFRKVYTPKFLGCYRHRGSLHVTPPWMMRRPPRKEAAAAGGEEGCFGSLAASVPDLLTLHAPRLPMPQICAAREEQPAASEEMPRQGEAPHLQLHRCPHLPCWRDPPPRSLDQLTPELGRACVRRRHPCSRRRRRAGVERWRLAERRCSDGRETPRMRHERGPSAKCKFTCSTSIYTDIAPYNFVLGHIAPYNLIIPNHTLLSQLMRTIVDG